MALGTWSEMFEKLNTQEIKVHDTTVRHFLASLNHPETQSVLRNVPEELLEAFCDVIGEELESKKRSYRFHIIIHDGTKIPRWEIEKWESETSKNVGVIFSNRHRGEKRDFITIDIRM